MLVYRLRQANRKRLDFTGCDAPVRVARVLVEISETYGRPTQQGVRTTIGLAAARVGRAQQYVAGNHGADPQVAAGRGRGRHSLPRVHGH
jgi:hypothetical protein